jgi:hypothetical protein
VRIGKDAAGEVRFTLTPGYRVIANVESPAPGGQLVRVLNDANASMDEFLDSESDRRFEAPGGLSLGPLAPRVYVFQLQAAAERPQRAVRIADHDVFVTIK